MRRRRFIGVYRGLRKSMGGPWLQAKGSGPRQARARRQAGRPQVRKLADRSALYNDGRGTEADRIDLAGENAGFKAAWPRPAGTRRAWPLARPERPRYMRIGALRP